MSHVRKEIRAAARVALTAALPAYSVRRGAIYTLAEEKLPALTVITPRDQIARGAAGETDHGIELLVNLYRVGTETVLDDLDDDAALAEAAVLTAIEALAWVEAVDLELIETATPSEASRHFGVMQMTFRATAIAVPGDPDPT